jgi:hypothetical protein
MKKIFVTWLLHFFYLSTFSSCSSINARPDAILEEENLDVPKTKEQKILAQNQDKFETCARDSISVQTGIKQKIKFNFLLTKKGEVKNLKILGLQGPDPDLYGCLARAVQSISFPNHNEPSDKVVTYSFTLKAQ